MDKQIKKIFVKYINYLRIVFINAIKKNNKMRNVNQINNNYF